MLFGFECKAEQKLMSVLYAFTAHSHINMQN